MVTWFLLLLCSYCWFYSFSDQLLFCLSCMFLPHPWSSSHTLHSWLWYGSHHRHIFCSLQTWLLQFDVLLSSSNTVKLPFTTMKIATDTRTSVSNSAWRCSCFNTHAVVPLFSMIILLSLNQLECALHCFYWDEIPHLCSTTNVSPHYIIIMSGELVAKLALYYKWYDLPGI